MPSALPLDPVDVRDRLVDVLREDLVGPISPDEILVESPSHEYLTGFLVPFEGGEAERSDPDGDDEIDMGGGPEGDEGPEGVEASKRKALLPASIGVSVLVPEGVEALDVTARWGDYLRADLPAEGEGAARKVWQRKARSAEETVRFHVDEATSKAIPLETRPGLELEVLARRLPGGAGAAVSVFLVNRRAVASPRDCGFAFQASLEVRCGAGFVARENRRGRDDGQSEPPDFDEQVADLQYRHAREHAVGHGVATEAFVDQDERCRRVETVWIPSAQVEKVVPAAVGAGELGMEALAACADLEAALRPLADAYGAWIAGQAKTPLAEEGHRGVLAELVGAARYVEGRLRDGIAALADPDTALAFRIANRAMARVARQSRPDEAPAWYPFQLAFVLMNLRGIVEPTHASRRDVDLLFFPTGGGKTEAYLGLAAFTLAHRRLRHADIRGAGVSVLMRYTLRLLTLDQLRRAAALVCALELERDLEPRLGKWPFEIGLWVGRAATPNRMGKKGDRDPHSAREKTLAYRSRPKESPVPIPIEKCPWCGEPFKPPSFRLAPGDDAPSRLEVRCVKPGCAWSGDRPLPIVAVDETIYRRLPCFIIATVDKFAQLPWVGETAGLFGRVTRHDAAGFYGACDGAAIGAPLAGGRLPPPDLIIQDELHLIGGALGTMVGLYETAIDALTEDAAGARAKVVASTATVRRAAQQIRALFGRGSTVVFPPPGPNVRDSFFARAVPVPPDRAARASHDHAHARRYVGVAAPGRSLKKAMLRTHLALLSAAQRLYEEAGGHDNPDNPAAPYMTLVGYFNSLRELGGSRRIVEDEVKTRLYAFDRRRPEVFAKRSIGEVVELTSRVPTWEVAAAHERLRALPREKARRPVDVVLATNMIAVGLDIPRLGLMVVLGQPKATAEYIQATSRVGRVASMPGLVVTLYNAHRPRDRSHHERFQGYHESFYRAVEAVSVTPFSPRAVDRAGPAAMVALARLHEPMLTPAAGAGQIEKARDVVVPRVKGIFEARAKAAFGDDPGAALVDVGKRVGDLFDSWRRYAGRLRKSNATLCYTAAEKGQRALLHDPLDTPPDDKDAAKFKAQRSLRDVEPSVNLFVRVPEIEVE